MKRNIFIFSIFSVLTVGLTVNAQASTFRQLEGHVPKALANLKPLSRLDPTQKLQLSIGLPLRNPDHLAAFLADIYNPSSPNYRHYITPQEFTDRFGPTAVDYQKVKDFAQAHGLHIMADHPNRMVLDVEGSVRSVESTFNISMSLFQHPTENRTFYAPVNEPVIDALIPISHISGLDNYQPPSPRYHLKNTTTVATKGSLRAPSALQAQATPNYGSASGGSYAGNDFRAAYVPGVSLTGTGQTVALLEYDGYFANDITSYESAFARPSVPLITVPVSGGVRHPGSANAEVALDIEMVLDMAPGLSGIYVYEAPINASWDSILSRIANDNICKQISCSWGGGTPDPIGEQIFMQMAAQGQSFFTASGDSDAYTGAIPFPSDSPNVTSVGGTTLTTTGAGGSYVSEKVWNWGYNSSVGEYVGSSGGSSTTYAIPSYQRSTSMANNQGSTTKRNLPDVAMTADNIYVTYNNGSAGVFGGTSAAAPLWAAFLALVNQQSVAHGNAPIGFINPTLYATGNGTGAGSNFHDITSGNNLSSGSGSRYAAVSGYDLTTGWGTPAGSTLINTLSGSSTAPVPGNPVISVASTISGTAGTVFSYQVVASQNPTSYGASNLPPGLSINSTSGLITGTPNASGNYSVTLSATNSSGPGTATSLFAIAQPLASSAPTITSTLTSSATNGVYFGYQIFATNSPTSFSATGLPAGLIIDTGAGEIYGTPTVTGSFSVTMTASNAYGTGTATWNLAVAPPSGPVIYAPHQILANLTTSPIMAPNGNMILASDGNFYGTTGQSSGGNGSFFRMSPSGTLTVLHNFLSSGAEGTGPNGTLVTDGNGNFYGYTSSGAAYGDGSIFKVTSSGTLTTLASFSGTNGNDPSGLVLASDGNLYGTTLFGGTNNNGVFFKLTTSGVLSTVYNFSSPTLYNPNGSLIQGKDGNFYGCSLSGLSSAYYGAIYCMTPTGTLTIFYGFPYGDGSAPTGSVPKSLMQSSDGTFYGTAQQGGSGPYGGCGTLFKLSSTGVFTLLHVFSGADGLEPDCPPILGADGNFYGTTSYGGNPSNQPGGNNVGNGTIYCMAPNGTLNTIYAFSYTDGRVPNTPLVPDGLGNFYGTTLAGGVSSGGNGTIYKITPFYAYLNPGAAFSYPINATQSPTSYSATGLPSGFSVNTATGQISGTAGSGGVYNVTLSATNAYGVGTAALPITIDQAPSFTASTLSTTISINNAATFDFGVTGYPAPTVTLTSGTLPNNMLLTATGQIAGAPTGVGVYSGTITASNGVGSAATQSYTLTVVQPPTITSTAPVAGQVGQAYSYTLVASGFPAPTFSVTSGSLPPGLTLSSNGQIAGTPTGSGVYTAQVTATNGVSPSTTQNLSLTTTMNFSQWAASSSLTGGATGTPQNDAVQNLIKYAFDINPTHPMSTTDRAALPTVGTTTLSGANYLTLTYRENPTTTGLTYGVTTSSDLQTWSPVSNPTIVQTGTDSTTGDPIMQVQVPASGSRLFVRLQVTSN